jgi:hypothetical protein
MRRAGYIVRIRHILPLTEEQMLAGLGGLPESDQREMVTHGNVGLS